MLQGLMKRFVAIAGSAVVVAAASAGPLQLGGVQGTNIADPFTNSVNANLSLENSVIAQLDVDPTLGVPTTVIVPLGDLDYELDLAPHSVRADGYGLYTTDENGELVELESGPERTMRGTVVGLNGSRVAASILPEGLYARIMMPDGGEYWVEPLANKVPGATFEDHAIYHNDDIIPAEGMCEAGDDMWATEPPEEGPAGGLRMDICVAQLGVDADFQYYQDYNSSTTQVETRINSVINTVNLQYESEVFLSHSITGIVVRTSNGSNPYTSNDAGTLLNQTRSEWLGLAGSIPHDLAQLFTGRNVNGGTIGIAWLGAVCSSLRYSVVESDCCGSFGCATDLSAHEFGHNWGADHCTCTGNTMNPFIVCANDFTTNSINDITGFANSINGCLDCVPQGPVDTDVVTVNVKGLSALVDGGPAEAQDSDNSYVRVFSSTVDGNQRCKTVFFMDGAPTTVSRLDMVVEVSTDAFFTNTRVHLRQFNDNGLDRAWIKIEETFPTDPNDTITGYVDIANPNLYVKDSNGRIHVRVFANKANTTLGFIKRVDHVEVIATP